jgi:tRNA(adenine34) deaminase
MPGPDPDGQVSLMLCESILAHSRRGRGHLEGASIWAKIGRIVYGAERDQVHPMYFEDRHLDTMDFVRDAFRDDLSLSGGLLADECAALYVGPDEEVPQDEQFNR